MMPGPASGRALRPALLVLLAIATGCGGAGHPQQPSCTAACQAADGPCSRVAGAEQTQCLAWCEQSCGSETAPPLHSLDPRCSDRTATGRFDCTIYAPVVTRRETSYPDIVFAPGDIVEIKADGCVQTGGGGDGTWKRYVNPSGPGADRLYHGLIRIPTAQPAGGDLVRIQTVLGKLQTVTGTGAAPSELVLHLGYEDDGYKDNGYLRHDDGADHQCRFGNSNDGGPAHVTITICRDALCAPSESRFDFDVISDVPYLDGLPYDPNGLLYNPRWSWQRRPQNQGQVPSTSLCHEFSERVTILGIPIPEIVPSFSDCTAQTDLSSVDVPEGLNADLCWIGKGGPFATGSFLGHVNWFPVTLEGKAYKVDHGSFPLGDDDYTFAFSSYDGDPLSVNDRPGLHIELDSRESINHFQSEEWKNFRKSVDDGNLDLNIKLFTGHTILTGMFGMDGEHGLKAELHPLFALATRRDDFENDPSDDVWLMFARNRGDEGFCSSQLWDAGFEDYTVRLPWLTGMTSVDVSWSKTSFEGTDGTSGPIVAVLPPPSADAGVYVTFHLGPAASSPFVDGALHLSWTGTAAVARRPVIAGGPAPAGPDEADHVFRKAIEQLSPAQRQELVKASTAAGGPVRATHRLAPGTLRRITAAPAVRRTGQMRAIKAGPATEKNARDRAVIHALCAATRNAPAGLPPAICQAAAAR
jgi:hypothetical protein